MIFLCFFCIFFLLFNTRQINRVFLALYMSNVMREREKISALIKIYGSFGMILASNNFSVILFCLNVSSFLFEMTFCFFSSFLYLFRFSALAFMYSFYLLYIYIYMIYNILLPPKRIKFAILILYYSMNKKLYIMAIFVN